jgi:hypothetical protein
VRNYLFNVAIAFDVMCNVVLGGYPDETLSARSGRAAHAGKLWGKALAGALGFFFPNHCRLAELHDEQRAEYIVWLESQADPAAALRKAGVMKGDHPGPTTAR